LSRDDVTHVAIIGVGLRLPHAETLDELWDHLEAGRSLIREPPPARRRGGGMRAGWLDDAERFDAGFFRISRREAELMDPQQRMALELAWAAIEDSAQRPSLLAGSATGVYVGIGASDYAELIAAELSETDAYVPTGTAHSIVANRISHFLDFHGPSMAVDTACASSITALQQAVLALESGDCSLALAGAVNLCLAPNRFEAFRAAGQTSPDGSSRAFDAGARGYARGEGGAMLLLKPLEAALADGDPVHGLIRGVGTRHGGRTNSLTATTPAAHERLIVDVYERSGLDPATIDYVEAHAQGALLGDPIEVKGLATAFANLCGERPRQRRCGIGSIKGNVGHLEAAAGMAGIVKVLASMKHGALPATAGFQTINPLIALDEGPFEIVADARPWPRVAGVARRAAVSTIGFGGVGGHVILEDCLAPRAAHDAAGPALIALSARSGDRLTAQAESTLAFVRRNSESIDLHELAYTLQTGREAMEERAVIEAQTVEGLAASLERLIRGESDPSVCLGSVRADRPALVQTREETALLVGHWLARAELRRIALAWTTGVDIDWTSLYGQIRPARVHCMTYPFERTRYWLPGSDRVVRLARRFTAADPLVAEHRVNGTPVLPWASLQLAAEALEQADGLGRQDLVLSDIHFLRSAPVEDEMDVVLELTAGGDGMASYRIDAHGERFAEGRVARGAAERDVISLDAIRARCRGPVTNSDDCHRALDAIGIDLGPSFRSIETIHRGDDELIARTSGCSGAALDAVAHVRGALDTPPAPDQPFSIERVEVHAWPDGPCWIHVRGAGEGALDIDVCDDRGAVFARFSGMAFRTQAARGSAMAAPDDAVRRCVLETIGAALKLDPAAIDVHQPYADYGLDSITGVAVVHALNERLHADLSTTVLFEHSTVERLAAHLRAHSAGSRPAAVAASSPRGRGDDTDPIAIVGMSGRFAHSRNVDELWAHLAGGAELIDDVTRWDLSRLIEPPFCHRGGFLSDIDAFDARFFRISGVEAMQMDPQQRFFLEESWLALEDAGYAGASIEGSRCGVYTGAQGTDYPQLAGEDRPAQAFWGSSDAVIPARIAYFLDLRGPTVAVNTACSSSLVAVHLACQALRTGEIDFALAGGVFIQSTESFYVYTNRAAMVSPTGRCYAFDARADGFVPGEGVGVVVLRRLSDAVAAGDHILGVIRGSGISQDGRTNGLAAPSLSSQERLQSEVYERFGIDPAAIQMVEAHGTGTALGDPVELEALTRSFRRHTAATGFCALGSIKTNLGHTASAAGVAGMIKVLLALKHRQIPPSINFEHGNPAVDFDSSPFFVNTELRTWAAEGPRCAAISGFSFCGTNAHLVIEEAAAQPKQRRALGPWLFALSAHTESQLERQIEQLDAHLAAHPDADLGDVGFTLLAGRRHFGHRFACLASSLDELRRALQSWRDPAVAESLAERYVNGEELDPGEVFGTGYRRVALPTYPFARERFWPSPDAAPGKTRRVHDPGDLVRDHVIQGRAVVPAALYLELVRAAARAEGEELVLRDLVWLKPATERDPLHVELATRDGEETQFAAGAFARGRIVHGAEVAAERVSLDAVLGRCTSRRWEGEDCYRRFAATGAEYGPSLRGLRVVHTAEDEALGRISASAGPASAILDAAFQTALLLVLESTGRLAMPFSAERIEIRRELPNEAWVHVSRRGASDGLQTFDLAIYDSDGELCARIRGLVEALVEAPARPVYSTAVWERRDASPTASEAARHVFVAGVDPAAAEAIGAELLPRDGGPCELFERVATRLQPLLSDSAEPGTQIVIMAPDGERARYAGLAALLKTVRLENPRVGGALVSVAGIDTLPRDRLAAIAAAECADGEIRYAPNGERFERAVVELTPSVAVGDAAIVPDGVYWITGGLGAIGKLVAGYVARTPGVRVVLTGRSESTEPPPVAGSEYWRADVADAADTAAVVSRILARHGRLDGIFHCAGALRDAYLLDKRMQDAREVFAPKVDGTTHIDEATRDVPLDFLVGFSSVAALHGSVGQADYSAANAFLDAFAQRREQLVEQGLRSGRTISINWSLWADGGMTMPRPRIDAMRRDSGLEPMPSSAAIAALDTILTSTTAAQIGVAWGDPDRIRDQSGRQRKSAVSALEVQPSGGDTATLLTRVFAEVAAIDPAQIRTDVRLEEYGLDSILAVTLTDRLESTFGPLPKTLFFEHVTLDSAAAYLSSLAPVKPAEGARSPQPAPDLAKAGDARGSGREIAIVGLAGRYPKAPTLDALWRMLRDGEDAFEAPPSSRFDHEALYFPTRDVPGKTTIRSGTFLERIDEFDPRYFSISQRDAELMSPEARLLLMTGVEAFEDAGYSRETLQRRYDGNVGVLIGSMNNSYLLYGFESMLRRGAQASGTLNGAVPNLLSYFYGFRGPSLFIDAMCASSSVAIHQAVQMLRARECGMVFVGGVNLMLHPFNLIATSQEHYTTTTGDRIRSYGVGADGTIVGEGVGAVVLKPLADAEDDGDHVYGVIRGTAVTNAAVRNGFTVPNPRMQALAIENAVADAGIDARTVSYFEGHGSGTSLGDPIEIQGATTAFAKQTSERGFCPIGSVKSNVGHLLAAAGLAGLTKVLLQMRHGELVPSLHADELNPAIEFAQTPFVVQRSRAPWPRPEGHPRRAGITSIGAGGMNSHLVVEEYEERTVALPLSGGPQLLVFSAMTPERLDAWLDALRAFIDANPDVDLQSLAYTLQAGKNALPCRLAVVAGDFAELRASLSRRDAFTANVLREAAPDPADVAEAVEARDLERVAAAWIRGANVDWERLHRGRRPRRLSLPPYPFEKVRCWYPQADDAPSLARPLASSTKLHPFVSRNESGLHSIRFLLDLRIDDVLDYRGETDGQPQIVSTFVLDVAFAVARLAGAEGSLELRDVRWLSAVAAADTTFEYTVEPVGDALRVGITSAGRHLATAVVGPGRGAIEATAGDLRRDGAIGGEAFYDTLRDGGFAYGPYVQPVTQAFRLSDDRLLLEIGESPLQHDHAKKRVTFPPAVLAAIEQGLQFLAPSAPQSLREIATVRLADASGETRFALIDLGAREIRLLDSELGATGVMSGVQLGARGAHYEQHDPRDLGEALRASVAAIAGFDAGDIDDVTPLQAYGFDSISLTRLAERMNGELGYDITPAVFFEHETIGALEQHLRGAHEAGRARAPRRLLSRPDAPSPGRVPVAIIGMAGRFPQCDSVEELWMHLAAGDDLVSHFPRERYGPLYQAIVDASDFPPYAGVVRDVDMFDAELFEVSRLEAELMDPHHRLALGTVWTALEESGYPPQRMPEATAIYFGMSGADYANLLTVHGVPVDAFTSTGNSHAMLANRISYMLDIHGPSEPVDTACSSSLVAIHRAVESLQAGRCEMALAGGANLLLSVDTFVGAHMAGMLSPEGRCRTFSAAADGYVRGEGIVALVLKPLDAAERDGDRVLGLIAGSAENHGGRSSSLTAPNVGAQADVVTAALDGIDPATVDYVEAHGTGTPLGDPAEVNALKRAFGRVERETPVGLGSIKTNIGHLEAAAGAAGVVKVLLALEHGELPATLHCSTLNPHLRLGRSFEIVREPRAWSRAADAGGAEAPRRAGVSSFGFGGANAHVVIEEYVAAPPREPKPQSEPQLIVISARSEQRLRSAAVRLLTHIDASELRRSQLAGVARTLQVGREPMEARLAFRAESIADMRTKLDGYLDGRRVDLHTGLTSHVPPAVTRRDRGIDPRPWLEDRADELLARWAGGEAVDWALLYVDRKPPLVSLPTYPLGGERYWVPAPEPERTVASPQPPELDEVAYVRGIEAILDGAS
jgi:polyketide synthase PksL